MSNRECAELAERRVGAFDEPVALVAAQLSSIHVLSQLVFLGQAR
jgi:hypothetical protein